jgi:dTDP-4-amino-4,6-dideoxygalactose transaminase
MPYYRERFGYSQGDYPVAEEFYAREISIPMYHEMEADTCERVIDAVASFFTE